MQLLKLELKNFKGLTFTLEPNGDSVNVYGANATGKTTLADANNWLLFDKDSQFRSQFEIKTIDPSGKHESGLKHSVKGKYKLNSGEIVEFEKVYYEKWVKPKGKSKAEFKGNTTDYYIGEVPAKKKEYVEAIAYIAPAEEQFRVISSLYYFPTIMDWQERRKLVLDVCGDVSDADVIATSSDLADLLQITEKRTLEEHKRMITAKRQAINKELERIPVRIDEQDRGKHDIYRYGLEDIKKDLAGFEEHKASLLKELDELKYGGGVKEKEQEVSIAKQEVEAGMNADREQINFKINGLRKQSENIERDIKDNDNRLNRAEGYMAEAIDPQIKKFEDSIELTKEEWHKIYESELDPICSECGQPVPEETNSARKNALLDKKDLDGQNLKEALGSAKKEKAEYVAKMDETRQANNDLLFKKKKLDGQINAAEKELSKVEPDRKLMDEVIRLEKELEELKAGDTSGAAARIGGKIIDFDGEIDRLQRIVSQFDENERIDARIVELKAERQKLSEEFDKIERELFLIQEFTKAKVSMLEEKINSKFKFARFKMFNVQVNGEIDDCCEVTYDGVPFNKGLNHGAQILVALDIISTLQKHYNTTAPVFVDNREAVSSEIEFDGQLISLIVSDDNKLITEYKPF
jgi:hypothetical protein